MLNNTGSCQEMLKYVVANWGTISMHYLTWE